MGKYDRAYTYVTAAQPALDWSMTMGCIESNPIAYFEKPPKEARIVCLKRQGFGMFQRRNSRERCHFVAKNQTLE